MSRVSHLKISLFSQALGSRAEGKYCSIFAFRKSPAAAIGSDPSGLIRMARASVAAKKAILQEWMKKPIGADEFSKLFLRRNSQFALNASQIAQIVRSIPAYALFRPFVRGSRKRTVRFIQSNPVPGHLCFVDTLYLKGFFGGQIVLSLVDFFTKRTYFEIAGSATSSSIVSAFMRILHRSR